jgi:hypothetical protein
MSLVQYMDRTELNTRELKHESCMGFDDRNEPTFRKFPNCEHCNSGNYSIEIPNNKPIIEIKMLKFPSCEHCNTDHAVILIEEII